MQKCRVSAVLIAAAVILSALFCSCSPKAEISKETSENLRELAEALGGDIREKILPNKSAPDSLAGYDYVVSGKGYSKGTEVLAIFFADYKAKSDCEVTLITTDGSFVVSRISFIDGAGYYLRYEYKDEMPESFEVRGQTLTSVDLEYKEASEKWTLTLFDGKKQRALFAIDG